jgi:subtilisin family serine protease
MRLLSSIARHRFLHRLFSPMLLALAVVALAGIGGDALAQRATDVGKLSDLSQRLSREVEAKRGTRFQELLRSTNPAQQALNNDPSIQLMYVRENGMPAYYTVDNQNAARTIRTYDVWPVGVGNGFYSLTGSTTAAGELAIWDQGSVYSTHQEFGGRVTLRDAATPSQFHATHVAGTLIAAGVVVSARGGSYAAPLDSYDWDLDTSEMATAAASGLQVSNHSYGYVAGWYQSGSWYWFGDPFVSMAEDYGFGYYDGSAIDFDQVAYDAPNYLICVAAGNERDDNGPGATTHYHYDANYEFVLATDYHPADGQSGGFDTITYLSTAKNILCVGAIFDIPLGWTQPSDVVQAAFSSWGPTDDGRIKPDIVANGTSVNSCTNTAVNAYTTANGTSMATPNAAGSINLIAQDYETVKGGSPWSSTLKALAINAADEAGAADGPDYSNGWGLLNVHRMADIVHAAALADLGLLEAELLDGETDEYFFEVSAPQDVRVTIVWTDPPGTASPIAIDNPAPKLINDLDLRVTHLATTTTTLPWKLDVASPASAATQADNVVDNVEQIDVDIAPVGTYRVTVTHKGSLDPAGAQDYSLVYRGMHVAQQTPVGPGGTPAFTLSTPYPSPVTGSATIDFSTGQPGRVSISVYDVTGRRIATLLDVGHRAAGPGSVTFDARTLPSGVYFVKMQTTSKTLSKKITIVK